MMRRIRLYNIKLSLDDDEKQLKSLAARALHTTEKCIKTLQIVRRALDARKGHPPCYHYSLELQVEGKFSARHWSPVPPQPSGRELQFGQQHLSQRPLVIGAGPAGLFAALYLARYGYAPLLLERGQAVEQRHADILAFYRTRDLNPESNFVYGEGGAGAYSDGKLVTGRADVRIQEILATFVQHGAPPEIIYDARPHVGSDRLRPVLVGIRQEIISKGGELLFGSKVERLITQRGRLCGVELPHQRLAAQVAIIAPGSHAADTYHMLLNAGVKLAKKPFQLGVRVEHPQAFIDAAQYGASAGHPRLGPAYYKLVARGRGMPRDVFSFCMCPGGIIIPATEEAGKFVTNGMSAQARDSGFANAGLVSTITPEELPAHPLAGLEFRTYWEKRAFAAGPPFYAPGQTLLDFLHQRQSRRLPLSSYPFQTYPAQLADLLPPWLTGVLAQALQRFDHQIKGFIAHGIITGPESRASAPVRILRTPETLTSVSIEGLYPAGEGAGYAGGIISAALDGIRVATAVMARYAPARASS